MNALKVSILFVVTPFLPEHQPALGVSSLLAVLRAAGYNCRISYLNLEYREMIGTDLYFMISRAVPAELLLGEMIFSRALWGDQSSWDGYVGNFVPSFMEYARQVPRGMKAETAEQLQLEDWTRVSERMRTLHYEAPAIVAGWADRILSAPPSIVAFTSTFQQNVASLALAKEIRERVPRKVSAILFGGANCEDDMGRGLADNFAVVDRVHSGEAEVAIIDLIEEMISQRGPPKRYSSGPSVSNMNSLPVPDFDDYFAAIARTDLVNKANLVAEASRGCWWGAKAHCTFCGLNGTTMAYRSKAAPRLIAELVGLAERYGRSNFLMADNILDLNYLKTVFPELIAQGRMLQMFFETKSNLRKDQLELLAAAGVIDIQPGIESLSTPILQGMKKGTTRLQNVQLLKWSEEFGVTVKWNFLHGFFGEEPVEYAAMAVVIPSLRHLPPPSGCARVRLDRFSPYWKSSALHGISRMRHFWSYDFAYVGLPAVERERLAYFFESDRAGTSSEEDYTTACIDAVNDWQAAYARGATLELSICDGDWFVVDTRESPVVTRTRIAEHEVRLLRVLDRHRNRAMVVGKDTDLARALATMIDRRWVVQDGEEYLSVVLDRSERSRLVERRVSIQMQSMGLSTVTEQRDHIDKHSSSSEVTYVSG